MKSPLHRFILIAIISIICGIIALPKKVSIPFDRIGFQTITISRPSINLQRFNIPFSKEFDLKQGLDIQGGSQIVLRADMSGIASEDREEAIIAAKEVIERRVDLFGVNEPLVQTSQQGEEYRIIVELAGVDDPQQAIEVLGTTAELEFKLQGKQTPEATISAQAFLDTFGAAALTGADLQRATVQFDSNTNAPVISIRFNTVGTQKFADLTKVNVNGVLGIFLDGYPIMLPRINQPILDGQAMLSGEFTLEEAKQLAVQLNAGALPVPISVIQQKTIGASLGQDAVEKSVRAGVVGIGLVMVFMIIVYGWKGFLADLALCVYALITIALYKICNITLTLPGIAGLLLSVGMAVDANILIFERIKEELRAGKTFEVAMKLGFGRAWDSIKDANFATIFTALVLINPLGLSFLNRSGLVRGFGVTLLIGVLVSLFTGIVVTRTFLLLFLKDETK